MIERVYTPSSHPRGFSWTGFSPRAYVDLLVAFVRAQLKIRYSYTVVGLGWAILNPLLQMFVYAFIFGAIFSADRAEFRLFLLAGLLPWQAFSHAITACVSSLVNQADLLRKAPFPSELLPVSYVFNSMFTFFIVFGMFVTFLLFRGYPAMSQLGWILAAITIEIVFLAGLALLVSTFNVFFRDTEQLIAFGVWVWFFLTPIVYPLARLGEARADLLLMVNPMAAVVIVIQESLLRGEVPHASSLGVAALISVIIFAAGWAVFRRFQYELPKVA